MPIKPERPFVVRRRRTGAGDRPAGGRAQVSRSVVEGRLSLQVKYNATPSVALYSNQIADGRLRVFKYLSRFKANIIAF